MDKIRILEESFKNTSDVIKFRIQHKKICGT
jgi:hypothetical protein